jgi:hypothetical protein
MTEPAHPAADDETRLADRQRIRELILGYCRGVDRFDLDLVRAAYHPGGVDHHTGFDGPVEEYIPSLGRVLPCLDGTMHLVANHLVEFNGARAVSETYGLAVHWGSRPTIRRSTSPAGSVTSTGWNAARAGGASWSVTW